MFLSVKKPVGQICFLNVLIFGSNITTNYPCICLLNCLIYSISKKFRRWRGVFFVLFKTNQCCFLVFLMQKKFSPLARRFFFVFFKTNMCYFLFILMQKKNVRRWRGLFFVLFKTNLCCFLNRPI